MLLYKIWIGLIIIIIILVLYWSIEQIIRMRRP